MIHAYANAESIIAPTLFRPEFSPSLDPKRTSHSICNRTAADSGMRPGAVGNSRAQHDFVGTRCVGDHHGHGIEMIE